MVNVNYIPEQCDIILIDLDPQKGTEIAKRRPCLVLSKKALNQKTKRAFICPITSSSPFSQLHVALPINQTNITGTLILDQVRTIDYKLRNAEKVDKLYDLELYDYIIELIRVMICR